MSATTVVLYRVSRDDPHCVVDLEPDDARADIRYRDTALHRIQMDPGLSTKNTFFLPATADRYYEGDNEASSLLGLEEGVFGWSNPRLWTLLCGTRDVGSSLFLFRNFETTLVRTTAQFVCNEWARHVKLTIPAAIVAATLDDGLVRYTYGRVRPNHRTRHPLKLPSTTSTGFDHGYVAFSKCGQVIFPKPTGRYVTMMPFVLGDSSSLPKDLQCYHDMIEQCPYVLEEIGKVGYVTVHEVSATETDRNIHKHAIRRDLHIQPPAMFQAKSASFRPGIEVPKSIELFYGPDRYEGGIYSACNRTGVIEVWDALMDKDNLQEEVVDAAGNFRSPNLRQMLGVGTQIRAGELIWMTDMTPNEIRGPVVDDGQQKHNYFQYFQLVTPSIVHWDSNASTPNPKAPLPSHVDKVWRGQHVPSKSGVSEAMGLFPAK